MNTAYIGLGSNLGDSILVLQEAWDAVGKVPGIHPECLSAPYKTEPVGMDSSNWFINAAGILSTTLEPSELLKVLLAVEKDFGRTRDRSVQQYSDRILDLDLLFYEDYIMNKDGLVLPHPEIGNRLFVLCPLADIAPDLIHPGLQKTIRDLLAQLQVSPDNPAVEKVSWPDSGL